MTTASIASRIEKLEKSASQGSMLEPVIILASGYSEQEVSDFLKSRGKTDMHPTIILRGVSPGGQVSPKREPMRIL